MGIPETAKPTRIHLHHLSGIKAGHWEVTCGGCLGREAVTAPSEQHAWDALQARGWVHYQIVPEATGYAKCPGCVAKGETTADAVKRANKSRRWKS